MDNTSDDFGLISASSADQLIAALENFIVFWRGHPPEAREEPESRLNPSSIPGPLLRLLRFVGNWTCLHPDVVEDVPLLAIQDHLRSLDGLEISDDGYLLFLDEHSGNAVAATLPRGDDPPVWVAECLGLDRQGPWEKISDSLSATLATVSLQELFYGSRLCLSDTTIDRWLHSSRGEVVTVWNGKADPFTGASTRYSLWEGVVLIRESGDSIDYAANHENGVAFLNEHQGEIERLRLGLHFLATLTIEADGSAEVDFVNALNASGHAPPGTFDFAKERDRLLEASGISTREGDPWYVLFPRTGQSVCRGQGIGDAGLARSLLKKAISAVTFKSKHFDEHVGRLPAL